MIKYIFVPTKYLEFSFNYYKKFMFLVPTFTKSDVVLVSIYIIKICIFVKI